MRGPGRLVARDVLLGRSSADQHALRLLACWHYLEVSPTPYVLRRASRAPSDRGDQRSRQGGRGLRKRGARPGHGLAGECRLMRPQSPTAELSRAARCTPCRSSAGNPAVRFTQLNTFISSGPVEWAPLIGEGRVYPDYAAL